MATPTIASQTYESGSRIIIVKAFINGTGDDIAKLWDASSYTTSTDIKLMKIQYCLNGFSAYLLWDATSDVNMISLASDHPGCIDFHDIGGLINNSGAGKTGDINIITNGLASPDNGYILLYLEDRLFH